MRKMKLLLNVLFLAIIVCGCSNSNNNVSGETNLFLIQNENGDYGYIDNKGNVVIKPEYAYASEFSGGLACVCLRTNSDGKYGYIDTKGKLVIKPKFDDARGFSEGLACVRIGDSEKGKYGYINEKGKFVIETQFDYACNFSDGLACVAVGKQYGYIDKTGEFVIQPRFKIKYGYSNLEDGYDFSDGCVPVEVKGKYGYMNKKGDIVIPPLFDGAGAFSEGLAIVGFGEGEMVENAVIDKTGKIICGKPDFFIMSNISDGLIGVYDKKNECYGYIDKTGKMVFKIDFENINEFNRYIENSFTHSIKDFGIELGAFSEGLACAGVAELGDELYGYIDKTGKYVIKPQFDYAGEFIGGLAKVSVTDLESFKSKTGYIDKTGKWIYVERED